MNEEQKKFIGRKCTLVLKRSDGRVDFQTGIYKGQDSTHLVLEMNGSTVFFLLADLQKVEFSEVL
ncbi:MAG: hypothetical protein WCT31_03730 [Candidatus Micrarchaeia archaeon]